MNRPSLAVAAQRLFFIPSLLLLFLLSPPVTAQPESDPLLQASSPDSLAERITRRWPNVRLIGIGQDPAESMMLTGFITDLEKLAEISEMFAPAPVPNFATRAIAAVRSQKQPTYEAFEDYICRVYPEYDCAYDFDDDELHRAFTIAAGIVESMRQTPGPLYVVTTAQQNRPVINALLSFDSLTGTFRVLSYLYPFPEWDGQKIEGETPPDPSSYPPDPAPYPEELAILPLDSIEAWNVRDGAALHRSSTGPHQVEGFEFLWLHRKGEREKEFGPVVGLVSRYNLIGLREEGEILMMEASCDRCAEVGLGEPRMVRTGRVGWKLRLAVENRERLEEILESGVEIHLNVQLRFTTGSDDSHASRTGTGHVNIAIISDEMSGNDKNDR